MTSKPSEQRIPGPVTERQLRQHREMLLDEALEETFPASDPPSIAMPHLAVNLSQQLRNSEE